MRAGKGSKKIIVLSVDALLYEDMEFMCSLPNYGRLLEKASYAKGGMRCVYPSLTYPAHASMITGAYISAHGIFHNEFLDVGNPMPDWYWHHRDLKVNTILDVAKGSGYTTGCVNWPCMAGAPNVDYLVPEIWSEDDADDQLEVFAAAASSNVMPSIRRHYHKWRKTGQPQIDFFMASCAVDIIRSDQPDLMFVHFSQLDHLRHKHGMYGLASKQALAVTDELFGRMVEATQEAGNWEKTNFVVAGDHGQLAIARKFSPNILFTEHGLIDLSEDGSIKNWEAWCNSASLSCQVVLKDFRNTALRTKVEDLLCQICQTQEYGVEAVFTAEECERDYHLTGNFQYVMEGAGTCFTNNVTGELVVQIKDCYSGYTVSHGHLPHKGPQPAFIVTGPDFKENIAIPRQHIIDQAPTYAHIFGLNLPNAQGRVLEEILK